MAYEGILLTGIVTCLAGLTFVFVSTEALRTRRAGLRDGAVVFFAITGIHATLAGIRQTVAFLATSDLSWRGLDASFFYVASFAGALTVVPLVHLGALALGGGPRLARALAWLWLGLALLGYALFARAGLEGPEVSAWGSDWSMRSDAAQFLTLALLGLPALVCSVALIWHARSLVGDAAERMRGIGLAALVYYVSVVPDALGLPGLALLLARLGLLAASMIAFRAYFPPPPAPDARRVFS